MFKISPDETLKVVQELYEKKLVTYPRTDARVLSTAVAKEITKKYSHSRPNGKSCGTICKIYKGENIAKGQTSAYSVYEAWYKSAGHKANMERKGFKKFAVACYKMNGTYYWVTAFGY